MTNPSNIFWSYRASKKPHHQPHHLPKKCKTALKFLFGNFFGWWGNCHAWYEYQSKYFASISGTSQEILCFIVAFVYQAYSSLDYFTIKHWKWTNFNNKININMSTLWIRFYSRICLLQKVHKLGSNRLWPEIEIQIVCPSWQQDSLA